MKPHKNLRRTARPKSGMKFTFFFVCAALLMMNAAVAWVQNEFSQQRVMHIREEAVDHGVKLQNLKFRCAGLAALNTLRWKSISGQIEIASDVDFSKPRSFSVRVRCLDAIWVGLFPPLFEIQASGIQIQSDVVAETLGDQSGHAEKIDQGMLRFQTVYTPWNPGKARREAGALFHKLLELVHKGKTSLVLDFKAAAFFEIRGTPIQAGIESRRIQGVTFLRMPAQDLITISAVLDEGLTSQEIRILSENPILAPQLLKIRNYARTTAYRAGKNDASVPKDAYRHVLWSYLLTREFGEAFSEKVTRAHEINAVLDNTAAQSQMDFKNNAVGRQYARLGYEESTLLKHLIKDPAVICYSIPQKSC